MLTIHTCSGNKNQPIVSRYPRSRSWLLQVVVHVLVCQIQGFVQLSKRMEDGLKKILLTANISSISFCILQFKQSTSWKSCRHNEQRRHRKINILKGTVCYEFSTKWIASDHFMGFGDIPVPCFKKPHQSFTWISLMHNL